MIEAVLGAARDVDVVLPGGNCFHFSTGGSDDEVLETADNRLFLASVCISKVQPGRERDVGGGIDDLERELADRLAGLDNEGLVGVGSIDGDSGG